MKKTEEGEVKKTDLNATQLQVDSSVEQDNESLLAPKEDTSSDDEEEINKSEEKDEEEDEEKDEEKDEEEEEDEEDEEDVLNRPITDDSFVGTGPVDNVVNPAINSGYSDYDSDDSDFSNMSQFEPAE